MSDNHTKAILGATVAVGSLAAAGLAYLAYAKNADEPIPSNWKKVGHIIDLNCFPVKSCAPVKLNSFHCHVLGFEYESLYDRCFVISQKDKQVTARGYPKLVLIQPKVINNQLILSAPEKSDFVLDLNELQSKPDSKVQLWSSKVVGVDAGDAVADWISEFIVDKPGVFRLVYYPYSYPTKPKHKEEKIFKALKGGDTGAYHDSTSYMLINQGSIDALNEQLDHVVKPLQFRPNIVVKGPEAFEEDNYQWVRIGEEVIFRSVRPCTRCIFTTINPETAERNPNREPLETLIKTRTIIPKESPVMGQHLAIRVPGNISIGDAVYINVDNEA